MSRDKQIEERIAVIEIEKELCGKPCDICKANKEHCMPYRMAKKLAAKGYRKASDVSREIFEEIERAFFKYYDSAVTYSSPNLPYHLREAVGFSLNEMFMKVAELKKKYTEDEG